VLSAAKVLGRGHPDTIATTATSPPPTRLPAGCPAAMQLSEQCCADSDGSSLGSLGTLARMANPGVLFYLRVAVSGRRVFASNLSARCERPACGIRYQTIGHSLPEIGDS